MGDEGPYRDVKTLPVLYDSQTGRIVNNNPTQILTMLDREFDFLSDEEVQQAAVDVYEGPAWGCDSVDHAGSLRQVPTIAATAMSGDAGAAE